MFNLKIFISILLVLTAFTAKKSEALNLFELSLLGIGAGFVADQYFDTSIERSNTYEFKRELVEKFYDNQRKSVPAGYFRSLPLQEQLLLIEELESF